MDFDLSPEQRMLRESAYKWALSEWGPIAEKCDEEDWTPPDLFAKLGEMGFLGVAIDPDYGGSGLCLLSEGLVAEQLARVSPALTMSVIAHSNLCMGNIANNADQEQKRKYLPDLVSGEKIGALALTEPGAGSDALGGMKTRAEKVGDSYVLNGTKMFITNAPICDVMLVYAKTDPEAGPRGISAFIVESGFPGFSVSRKIKKVGMRGSPTAEVVFEDCAVPEQNLVGGLNSGIAVVTRGLDVERLLVAFICLGVAHQALEYSIAYSLERKQFGKPIGEFQMIQAKLADMYSQLQAARALTYGVAVQAQQSERGGKGTALTRDAASAVLFAAEMATRATNEAIQIHGGYGYCLEYPVQRLWRDIKLMEIGAGTSEIRRMIIARELLRSGSSES